GAATMQLLDLIPRPTTDGYFARTRKGWAWLLLYAQPLFLLNSFTVMTEMLLAIPSSFCRSNAHLATFHPSCQGLPRAMQVPIIANPTPTGRL
ncbi:MAG: hypothetical protein ACTHN5_08355, partial [Phycisphaerae bacterium]